MDTRICTTCATEYPATLEHFPPHKQCKFGLSPTCRKCSCARHREWKQRPENRERLSAIRREQYKERYGEIQREKERQRRDLHPLRVRAQVLRSGLRDRVHDLGIPFDMDLFTVDYIMGWLKRQPNCECCGCSLDLTFKHDHMKHDNSPSIDRIIPSLGYIEGNVALLCWRCNNLKRDATWQELTIVAEWLRDKAVDVKPSDDT